MIILIQKIDLGNGSVIGTGQSIELWGQQFRITQFGWSITGWIDLAPPKSWQKVDINAFEGGSVIWIGTDKKYLKQICRD